MATRKSTPAAPHAPPMKTVAVTALKFHTIHGGAYQAGQTYQVPEADVMSLIANGFAAPAATKTKAAKPAKPMKKIRGRR